MQFYKLPPVKMNLFLLEYILCGALCNIAYCIMVLFDCLRDILFYFPLAEVWHHPKILYVGFSPPFHNYFLNNCKIQQSSPDFAFTILL